MELAVGQYTRQGPIGAMHKISPFFKGLCKVTEEKNLLQINYHLLVIKELVWPLLSCPSFFPLTTMSSLPGQYIT
jgi:solute carrier family 6 GABA transporter-like protein 6/8/11/12/13